MLLVPQAGFSSADGTPCRKCYPQRFGAGKEFLMESERNELSSLFPCVASQIRNTLTSLHMAAAQLVSSSARECDIKVIASEKLRYTVYEGNKIYLLNTDYDLPITVKIIYGDKEELITLESLEMKTVTLG